MSASSTQPSIKPAEARAGFTISGAVAWSGLSRSALYREAGAGRLLFRKCGRTTIVDGASLAALVASLPAASIGAERSRGV
ncbi:excisionase [Roseomonas sp. BU-1]|uniref:Excisionase n=1 Tax=Falsiroseomonas selenitidurans TaxID=2716335 RepID=A0ABX1EBY8_9PROT|nr:excisionase [Falsiroseomonas selenitidurans]